MRRRPPNERDQRDLEAAVNTLVRDGAAHVTVEPLADLSLPGARYLRQRWNDMPEALRLATIHQMAASAAEDVRLDFERALAIGLQDASPEIRRESIEALWESESTSLLKQLLDALSGEEHPTVRVALVQALARYAQLASEDSVDIDFELPLEQTLTSVALDDESGEVRLAALAAAAYLRPALLEPEIVRAYDEGHDDARELAIQAMGRFGGKRWAPRVIDALLVGDDDLRIAAAKAAPYVEDRRIIPYLYEAAEDEEFPEMQLTAIWALGEIGGQNVQSFLESLRDTATGEVADAAESALENAALLEGTVDTIPVH